MRYELLRKAASAAQIRFEELEEWHHPQKQGGYQPESVVKKSMIHGFMIWTGATMDWCKLGATKSATMERELSAVTVSSSLEGAFKLSYMFGLCFAEQSGESKLLISVQ